MNNDVNKMLEKEKHDWTKSVHQLHNAFTLLQFCVRVRDGVVMPK